MTDSFSGQSMWLYLGYFDYHPKQIPGLHIDGGKMSNPFYNPGKNQLMWSQYLTPEGVALRYSHAFGAFEPFVTAGNFWLDENKTSGTDHWTMLTGFQGGTRVNFADNKVYLKVGVGNFNYTNMKGYPLMVTDSSGNFTAPGNDAVYNNNYYIMEYNGEVGGKLGSVPWVVYGDYVVNNGITNKDSGIYIKEDPKNNVGYIAGVTIGSYDKPLGLAVRYYYRYLQSDALIGAFNDSVDSGGGTDNHGNTVGLDLGLYKNVWASATYYMDVTNIAKQDTSRNLNYHRVLVDLNMKF
jgi:hypothetical protein